MLIYFAFQIEFVANLLAQIPLLSKNIIRFSEQWVNVKSWVKYMQKTFGHQITPFIQNVIWMALGNFNIISSYLHTKNEILHYVRYIPYIRIKEHIRPHKSTQLQRTFKFASVLYAVDFIAKLINFQSSTMHTINLIWCKFVLFCFLLCFCFVFVFSFYYLKALSWGSITCTAT